MRGIDLTGIFVVMFVLFLTAYSWAWVIQWSCDFTNFSKLPSPQICEAAK